LLFNPGEIAMSAPTYEDAQVILKLYELGDDPHMGKSWDFVGSPEFIDDYPQFVAKYPPGSDQYGYIFHYASWYELIGTLWKHKLVNQDLLFDWILVPGRWKRVAKFMEGYRADMSEPRLYENFEALAKAQS
jgi:hypothetical protein